MGVTREQFAVLTKGMKAVYPQAVFIPDQDAFNVWYSLLQDLDYEVLSRAIQTHMMTVKYPPTIAEIRAAATKTEEMTELEAWSIVRKALGRSGWHAEEEFLKLPEEIKQVVREPHNLQHWSQMGNSEVESVVQSNFMRSYRAVLARNRQANALPDKLRPALPKVEYTAITANDTPIREKPAPVPAEVTEYIERYRRER